MNVNSSLSYMQKEPNKNYAYIVCSLIYSDTARFLWHLLYWKHDEEEILPCFLEAKDVGGRQTHYASICLFDTV